MFYSHAIKSYNTIQYHIGFYWDKKMFLNNFLRNLIPRKPMVLFPRVALN